MTTENDDKTTANWMKEAQKGYMRMGVLILLNKKPSHGYEIMKEINSRTKGFWQPTPGGVYPILRDLEKSGYIKGHWETQKNRKLKVYKITQSGQTILKHAIVKQAEISNNIGNLFREFAREVLNVEAATALPDIPSLFSPFLGEQYDKADDLKQLEHQRRHMVETVKTLQEKIKIINGRITEIKKGVQNNSSQTSK
ncbi:MAG: PadR family transcriptional regulator [Chloroflexi bacterium]|nr:PadR family transcriptional regulator [Chloroflexota bacterium]